MKGPLQGSCSSSVAGAVVGPVVDGKVSLRNLLLFRGRNLRRLQAR